MKFISCGDSRPLKIPSVNYLLIIISREDFIKRFNKKPNIQTVPLPFAPAAPRAVSLFTAVTSRNSRMTVESVAYDATGKFNYAKVFPRL